jgi:predicted  nucleic acid-binding Zn-ribbon protein
MERQMAACRRQKSRDQPRRYCAAEAVRFYVIIFGYRRFTNLPAFEGRPMKLRHTGIKIVASVVLLCALGIHSFPFAGISRVIQERYRGSYENKALFLKEPMFFEKQYIYISGQSFRRDQAPVGNPRFKVGDQLRVLGLDFGGDEIKFKLGPIAGAGVVELIFKFDSPLQENFPNSGVFDKALAATFTEGLKYTEIEEAKRSYIEQEFDRAMRDIAATSSTNHDTVLKYVAPLLPAYQDLTHETETLQSRNQDLTKQVERSQAENKKLEAESKSQQAEITRLRTQTANLQEKIDNSASQLSKLGDDLRSAKGVSQNYQKELANLQRSLKIKIDTSRDLATQIAELGQVMQRIQRDNDDLQGDNGTLRSNLEKEQSENARRAGEIQDLQTSVRQKDDTIKTLTSKEDSLAHQYFLLKQTKDNLENVSLSLANLNTRVVDEKTEAGLQSGKINVFLGNLLLATFTWRLPERLSADQETGGEAVFATESIDNVRLTATERQIRQSLGERLKLRVNLISRSDGIDVKSEKQDSVQEIGERDRATWRWRLANHGAHDSRLALSVRMVNKNGDEIPLILTEPAIVSSNLVRQFRNYLQPISLALGAVIGALLMLITGLFRRVRHAGPAKVHTAPESYHGKKQL